MDSTYGSHVTSLNPKHGALVVVGSGPGIGSHVAALFAQNGFERIVLMSRNAMRLSADATIVRSSVPEAIVDTVTVDLAQTKSVESALKDVDRHLNGTPLECVFFNAARSGTSKVLGWPGEAFQRDLHISVVSLYTVVGWAIPQLLKLGPKDGYKPTFLVTSSNLGDESRPHLFSVAPCRAAQYNIVASCHKEFGPRGVHCALIVIGGRLGEGAPGGDAQVVAGEAWKLYGQEKGKGDLGLNLPDPESEETFPMDLSGSSGSEGT